MSRVVSVNEYWEDKTANSRQKDTITLQYATVVELTLQGEAILLFDGDSLPSKKTYRAFDHYIPKIGQRVQLVNNIIQGGVSPK